jgi:outer membrane protein TolC
MLPTSPEALCPSCGADPRLAGRYVLLERVGRGAHGVVYRCTDMRSGDTVAVKQVLLGNLDSDKARELVARRAQRGDAASYELRRIERERVVAEAWLASERSGLERAGARLEALLDGGGTGATSRAVGSLLPDGAPMALEAIQAATASRPDLLALGLNLEAATIEGQAAARWWLPDLRLEAGWKAAELRAEGRADGFMLGASLQVPLWDQAASDARIAEGAARNAQGQRALIESELRAELTGLHADAVRLHEVAIRFQEQSSAVSSELVRMVTAGHAGGEFSLLELLDAYRGATDDALRALEMALAARNARIELERLSGAGLP